MPSSLFLLKYLFFLHGAGGRESCRSPQKAQNCWPSQLEEKHNMDLHVLTPPLLRGNSTDLNLPALQNRRKLNLFPLKFQEAAMFPMGTQ